jgi:hypothetical protein
MAAAALAALSSAPIHAAPLQDQAFGRWRIADRCMRGAIEKVPDHDAASLAKRDQLVDECFKANRLPPRNGLAPADPPKDPAKPD